MDKVSITKRVYPAFESDAVKAVHRYVKDAQLTLTQAKAIKLLRTIRADPLVTPESPPDTLSRLYPQLAEVLSTLAPNGQFDWSVELALANAGITVYRESPTSGVYTFTMGELTFRVSL